eukprot:comp23507_c0_seq2/m.39399 comp23507_c0_seq2/g.39399  ORF comp23507_c0_seq2/g.39399 comp23507_c0_seq2/m.39399 type:complete len:874 (-) comp23507_c0_seq2:338-2959(-)
MGGEDNIARENREDDRQLLDAQWQKQQIKSFTAWVNSHLMKVGDKVEDLGADFQDGRRLIKLVETISGDRLRKPEKGKMRVHSIQNINIALEGIASKGVKLVGISAEEIADCNLKMILGMIWILILRFQIQDISVEEMSAKEGLLLWCQRKTAGYPHCTVSNFHTSFQDGNAFCALIHRHRPDLLNYDEVIKKDKKERLNTAFKVAEEHLGIPQMLDADDMLNTTRPDERSVMTYVAAYYHAFAGMGKAETAARRLSAVLGMDREFQALIDEYETRVSDLLAWIEAKTGELTQQSRYQSLDQVAASFAELRDYRKGEKPPKSQERAQLEAHYATLQTKLRLNNRPPYHPQEGRLVSDINAAWKGLDAAEKQREGFLRSEQERLDKLARLAKRFRAKAAIHNKWMGNRTDKMRSDDYGHDLPSVTALVRQHKAADGDIQAHSDRVKQLRAIADELAAGEFTEAPQIVAQTEEAEGQWQTLVDLAEQRKAGLDAAHKRFEQIDELQLEYATKAATFNTWVEGAQEELLADLGITTLQGLEDATKGHAEFAAATKAHQSEVDALEALADQIGAEGATETAYTSLSKDAVLGLWADLQQLATQREEALAAEQTNQEQREALRKDYATQANALGHSLEDRLQEYRDRPDSGTLEEQLAAVQSKQAQCMQLQAALGAVHEVGNALEEAKIYENPHANYTVEELDVLYEQLQGLGTKTINTLENQILMREQGGITEAQMKEYKESFSFFDKDKTGELSRNEFRSCLLSIGYDLPEPKAGEEDRAFDKIMKAVDPENSGRVTFEAFLDFMSRDKQDTNSAEQFVDSFRLIAGDKPYITEAEIRRELSPEVATYVLSKLKAYPGVEGGLDYQGLTGDIFASK